MKKLIALLAVVAASIAVVVPASATPENCYPDPKTPEPGIFTGYAYFMGQTLLCGGHVAGNAYHFSAKMVDSNTGEVLGVKNGIGYGDRNFDYEFVAQCNRANGTSRNVHNSLWIAFGNTQRSRNSPSRTCTRIGGTGPVTP